MTAQPVTTAYLDTTDAVLTVVTPKGRTIRTIPAPVQVIESHPARQAAWMRNRLRSAGFNPAQTRHTYPYGIAVPVETN